MNSLQQRLNTAKNGFQTTAKKVLCVCSAGILRSPTAARVLAENYGYNTRAVGCMEDYALIAIDQVLIEWADEIVFMEYFHFNDTKSRFDIGHKKCIILDIEDEFDYMDQRLVYNILESYIQRSIK